MFEEHPIGDLIANQVGGGTPSRQVPSYWNGPIPWASVKDFTNGDSVISSTQESITVQGLSVSASNLIPAGTPMICTRMAVGRSAFAPMDVAINQDVKALQPAVGTSRDYLLRLLQFVRPRAEAAAVGSTVKGIRIQDFLSILAPIAPAVEQSCIAEILTALDTTIRQTEAIIEKLKLVKQGLLHDLLTRGIDANGDLRPPQSQAPHLYKDSPLGWIAIDWCAVPLGKLASLQRGHDIVESNFILGPYPVISSSGVIGYHNVATACGPNVIVGRKGSIGTVHFVETDFWAHDTSLFVTNFFGNDQRFVFHLFDFMQLGQYGTKSGSPSLNRNDLHPKLVGRPSLDEQRGIVSIISAYSERLTQSIHERTKLKQLKSGLMDDLLTGRVRVTPLLNSQGAQS